MAEYLACLQPSSLGAMATSRRNSLAQRILRYWKRQSSCSLPKKERSDWKRCPERHGKGQIYPQSAINRIGRTVSRRRSASAKFVVKEIHVRRQIKAFLVSVRPLPATGFHGRTGPTGQNWTG